MADEFMGKMQGDTKQMAERIKTDQQKEIRKMEGS